MKEELSAGEEQEDGTCHEAPDKMCPEGTYATIQRQWYLRTGAAASSTAFLIAKFTLLPIGSMIGTALMGPAGTAIGFFAANALVAPIAIATGFWASRGPLECACFPRECIYSNVTNSCALDAPPNETATKNPFGDKLPMAGMKCSLNYKSDDTCGLQQCSQEDYQQTHPGRTDLWGIGGRKGKNLYNCLSLEESPTSGMLAVRSKLLNDEPNTIANRNKIFSDLELEKSM